MKARKRDGPKTAALIRRLRSSHRPRTLDLPVGGIGKGDIDGDPEAPFLDVSKCTLRRSFATVGSGFVDAKIPRSGRRVARGSGALWGRGSADRDEVATGRRFERERETDRIDRAVSGPGLAGEAVLAP